LRFALLLASHRSDIPPPDVAPLLGQAKNIGLARETFLNTEIKVYVNPRAETRGETPGANKPPFASGLNGDPRTDTVCGTIAVRLP